MKDTLTNAANRVFNLSHAFDDEQKNPGLLKNDWKAQTDYQISGLYAASVECVDIARRLCAMDSKRALYAFPRVHDAVTVPGIPDGANLTTLSASLKECAQYYEQTRTDDSAKALLTACADWMKAASWEAYTLADWDTLKIVDCENPVRAVIKSLEALLAFTSSTGKTE